MDKWPKWPEGTEPPNWIDVRAYLPPFYERVLIHVSDTNLFMGMPQKPVMDFMAELEPLAFYEDWGNNKVPYCWRAENGGNWFGQDVSHWMPIPPLSKRSR